MTRIFFSDSKDKDSQSSGVSKIKRVDRGSKVLHLESEKFKIKKFSTKQGVQNTEVIFKKHLCPKIKHSNSKMSREQFHFVNKKQSIFLSVEKLSPMYKIRVYNCPPSITIQLELFECFKVTYFYSHWDWRGGQVQWV